MLLARSRQHLKLLDETLQHALRAPHYRRAWRGRVASAAGLTSLPLLDKVTAAEHQEALLVGDAGSAALLAGVVSSATTRTGRPLRVPFEFDGPPRRQPKKLTLVVYSPRHGVRFAESDDDVLLPATLHANTIDVAWDLLTSERRFDALICPLSTLKWLTVGLLERGRTLRKLRLSVVGATGYPVTSSARGWLEAAWGCGVIDNYSLSELPGYAYPSSSGFHHWVGQAVWFELVDPRDGAPIAQRTGRIGELVATSLLPAARRMPLVRYRTGDLVELGPLERGSRGIRFRGRVSNSILGDARGKYLALGRDLLEIGEALPDVALEAHPAEVLRLVPPCDIGVPKIVVDERERCVHVELRFDPARYPARAKEVVRTFAGAVHRSVRVSVCRPGTLDVHALVRKL